MNIFSRLPLAHGDTIVTDESTAKADRIQLHRDKVRNGPVSWKDLTVGQQRRAKARAEKREVRKNFRAEVKNYFEKQRLAASVRAHLQIAGVIPFIDGREAPLHDQIVSTSWLVQRFGAEVTVEGEGTGHVSFRRTDVVDAMATACRFIGAATGYTPVVPEGYVPAISLDED